MVVYKSHFLREASQRGLLNQCTNFAALDEQLSSGKPVVGYWGTDPTANSLHVGHLFSLMMMRLFQRCGNKPILLVGGATGLIGDPSGRDTSRPMVSKQELESKKAGIKKSIEKFIKFGDGKTDAAFVDNYDWTKDLNWIDMLRDIGPHISVNRMLTMDSVRLRLEKEEHMSFLEFNYMVMQAFDFYHLYKTYGCTLQLCGADQWGNVVAGVDLTRRMQFINNEPPQEIYGLSTPLLTDKNGKKIGKTAGNAVWLNEELFSPYQYFQYFRNVADEDVEKLLKVYTDFSLAEIVDLMRGNINEAKKTLANEATKLCHGVAAAEAALRQATDIFENKSNEGLPVMEYTGGENSISAVVKVLGFANSMGDAKKLVRGGGVKVNDEKVDESFCVKGEFKLSVGKKQHVLVKCK